MFFSALDEIPAKILHHQAQFNRQNIEGINKIIAVSSGSDRVGKTTIAVNLAVMLAQIGSKIGLLDAEVNSGASEILGLKDRYIQDSKDLSQPVDNFGIKLVAIGSTIDGDPLENKCNILSANLFKRKYEIRDREELNQKIRVPFLGYVPLDPTVSQYKNRGLPIVLAEPSSVFTSALQIVIWAISSRISISALKT